MRRVLTVVALLGFAVACSTAGAQETRRQWVPLVAERDLGSPAGAALPAPSPTTGPAAPGGQTPTPAPVAGPSATSTVAPGPGTPSASRTTTPTASTTATRSSTPTASPTTGQTTPTRIPSATPLSDPTGLRLATIEVIPNGYWTEILGRIENDGPASYYWPGAVIGVYDGAGTRVRTFDARTSLEVLHPGEAGTIWGRTYVGSAGYARYEGEMHSHTAPPTGVEYLRDGVDVAGLTDRPDGPFRVEVTGTVTNNTGRHLVRIALDGSLYAADGRLLATHKNWVTVAPRWYDFPAGAQQTFTLQFMRASSTVPEMYEVLPSAYRYEVRAEGHVCPFEPRINYWVCDGA